MKLYILQDTQIPIFTRDKILTLLNFTSGIPSLNSTSPNSYSKSWNSLQFNKLFSYLRVKKESKISLLSIKTCFSNISNIWYRKTLYKTETEKLIWYHSYTPDISPRPYNIHFSQRINKGCPISIYYVHYGCKHSKLMPLLHLAKQAKIQKPGIEITSRSEQELYIIYIDLLI